VVDDGSSPSVGKFVLGGSQFDQSSYYGRLRKFMQMVDPRTLLPDFFLTQSRREACEALKKFRERQEGWENLKPERLWEAQWIVESSMHPDTGEVIPPPFRMSGFVPFGSPIVVGMLLAQGPLQNGVFQFLNQAHNASVNYFNANKSSQPPLAQTAQSFAVATSSAVTVCLAMERVTQSLNAPVARRFVPFVSVATSNVLNVGFMRRNELEAGISVFDEKDAFIGTSVRAAEQALLETAISRVVLPIPILVLSPILMMGLEKALPNLLKRTMVRVSFQAAICSLTFGLGLPISLALFRDRAEIPIAKLEPALQRRVLELGAQNAFYNKGL